MTPGVFQGFFWWGGNNTVGQTYTLSFDARSDNGKANVFQAGLEGNFLGTSSALTTNWTRYHYTINVTQADHNWVIYFQTSEADNVYIRKLQLECGDTPTPWNPSSGDVSNIAQTASQLTIDMKDAKGNISSFQQTADKLTSRVGSAEGNISQLQQDSKGLTSRVGSAEGNISQLQQTSDSLTSTLKNGGANLLNGTSDTEITNTYPTSGYSDKFWSQMSVPANQTDYVLSFDAKATVAGDQIICYMYSPNQVTKAVSSQNRVNTSNDGSTFFDLTTDWVRYWVHYTITPTSQSPTIIVGRTVPGGSGTVSFKCVQLECGSTPTPWSPSSGDISQLQQTASQLTSDIKDAKGNVSTLQQTAKDLTSRVGDAEGNISQLQQDSKGITSRVGNAEGNISQLQQTADRIKFSMAGQGLDLVDGLNGELVMGFSIPNTTWDGTNACLTLPTTSLQFGEILPQNAPLTNFYAWEAGKTYTQSIIIETDAQIKTDVQPQWTWYTNAGGHNAQSAELIDLGNHCYRLIGSYTPDSNTAKDTLRILDIWNFTSFVNITTGTYLKFRSPHFFCADDNSLSELKITADGINAYVKKSENSKILSSILSMDPDNSMLGQLVDGKVVAAINLSKEGNVQIDGSHISLNSATYIPDATIKSAMIESLEATKIKAGTLDASKIQVINLDANSITTGSFSAVLGKNLTFKTYSISSSSTFNFDDTKSTYENWFLNGETTADHVYNGPCYNNNKSTPLTPFMYVTSRGNGNNFTVTVWKDNDPTQYQRVWTGDHWTDWVTLPNSQNMVSLINLSPDGVTISGKHIELNGDTTIHGQLNLLPTDQREVDQNVQGFHNPWHWRDATVYAGGGGLQLQSTVISQKYSDDNTTIGGLIGGSSAAITTLSPTYLKFTAYPSWNDVVNNFSNQLCRTYIDAGRVESSDIRTDNFSITGNNIRVLNNKYLLVTNKNGTNFDGNGSVVFQVWGGVTLGQNTIAVPSNDFYVQQGNADDILAKSYSDAGKVSIHCNNVISQVANTVSSRLSVKTAITKVDYDRALMAIQNTDMYDYRYTSDESNQHYVSGIIDDIHDKPEYNLDPMLINKERTARIDANLLGYHHVVLQEMLKENKEMSEKLNELEKKLDELEAK